MLIVIPPRKKEKINDKNQKTLTSRCKLREQRRFFFSPATRYPLPVTRHPPPATRHPSPVTLSSATCHPWKSAADFEVYIVNAMLLLISSESNIILKCWNNCPSLTVFICQQQNLKKKTILKVYTHNIQLQNQMAYFNFNTKFRDKTNRQKGIARLQV